MITQSIKTLIDCWPDIRARALQVYDEFAYEPSLKHWHNTDSPLKYVDQTRALEPTGAKCMALASYIVEVINPYYVAELGPGACFLGKMLSLLGVQWTGYDIADRQLYKRMSQLLHLNVETMPMHPYANLRQIERPVDIIIATQCCFMNEWDEQAFVSFMDACRPKLRRGGYVILFLNPPAIGGNAERVVARYVHTRPMLPILGNGWIIKKENI